MDLFSVLQMILFAQILQHAMLWCLCKWYVLWFVILLVSFSIVHWFKNIYEYSFLFHFDTFSMAKNQILLCSFFFTNNIKKSAHLTISKYYGLLANRTKYLKIPTALSWLPNRYDCKFCQMIIFAHYLHI